MVPGTMVQLKMWGQRYGQAIAAHNDRANVAARAFQDALDAYTKELKQNKLTISFEPGPMAERQFNLHKLKKACIDAYLEWMRYFGQSYEMFLKLQKGIWKFPES
jgi:hypothetical protein